MASIFQNFGDALKNAFTKAGFMSEPMDYNLASSLAAKYNQLPQLDQFEAQSIGQILDYKNRYESAQKSYNDASRIFNDAGSTDAAKSQAQRIMQGAQQTMDEAHKGADFTRRVANNRGIDLSNYDAYNTSLDDANVNFVTKAQQDVSDLFAKDLTPDQYYRKLVRELRANGATKGQAERIAAEQTQDYAIDREARFNTAMQMYGQNGNGALTDLGIQMMDKFGRDHPDTLNLYGTMYATPSKQYEQNAIAAREANNQANAMRMAILSNLFSDARQDKAFNYGVALEQIKQAYKDRENQLKTQEDRIKAQQQADAKKLEEYNKSPQGIYENNRRAAIAAGLDPTTAHHIAMTQAFPIYMKELNDNTKDGKLTEQQQNQIVNMLDTMYGTAEYFLSIDDTDRAQSALGAIENFVTGENSKENTKWLDGQSAKYILGRVDSMKKVMNGEMTYQDYQNEMFRNTFELDDIHSMLKSGQNAAAIPIIEKNLEDLQKGNVHHSAHYSQNEALAIQAELNKLLSVAKGETTYDAEFGNPKKTNWKAPGDKKVEDHSRQARSDQFMYNPGAVILR